MQLAQSLLNEPGLSVSEIGTQLGYSSAAAFSHFVQKVNIHTIFSRGDTENKPVFLGVPRVFRVESQFTYPLAELAFGLQDIGDLF